LAHLAAVRQLQIARYLNVPITKKRIAVLFHSGDRHYDPSRYIVHFLANCWREDGHEVVPLYGVRTYVPADLILVHVNLSVVPEEYLEFASRYPIALNIGVADIRKTTISENLVRPGDGWDGPVIIKSDLNYAGLPERVLSRTWLERHWAPSRRARRAFERLSGKRQPFGTPTDYEVFDNVSAIPELQLNRPGIVVEKFRPEIENGLYHCRVYQFLGDRWTCTRVASDQPVVKVDAAAPTESVDVHEEVIAWRRKLKLDYGKLDYVVSEGEVVLLDANKTTGAADFTPEAAPETVERLRAQRRFRAEGLYDYFGDGTKPLAR